MLMVESSLLRNGHGLRYSLVKAMSFLGVLSNCFAYNACVLQNSV
jgi:hypothetical protein